MLAGAIIAALVTAPAVTRWALVQSTTGSTGGPSCSITDGGSCITDGDGNYETNERCVFRAEASFYVDATQFSTEQQYDYITLHTTYYSGTVGPNNVLLQKGDTVEWFSDYSVVEPGFKICATVIVTEPPSAPPSPPAAPGALFTFDTDPGAGWSTGPTDAATGQALSAVAPYGFNWRTGATPSSGTGPGSGVGGAGRYYYAEASDPRVPGDVFELQYDGSACGGE
jgi:hypothetical protein